VLAGGANFPDGPPWEGGKKVWYDDVFVLETPGGEWRTAGILPCPLAYGVSVSHKRGLILIGGSDARRHYASVWVLHWNGPQCGREALPGMPEPCANLCGALVQDTVYVAGGTATPDATNALGTFLAMDLARKRPGWRSLETWPGPPRQLATGAAHDGSFFLFGGASLHAGPDGKPVREWLRDAYRFTPGKGWKRLADLPRVAVAAPSPAPFIGGKLLILGGDDGTQVNTPPEQHRGFPRDILAYDPKEDRWEAFPAAPFARVTTPAVVWKDRVVVPSGEVRPGVRSPEVWALDIK
jgi:N-acetylneuraminic acid mutarotase